MAFVPVFQKDGKNLSRGQLLVEMCCKEKKNNDGAFSFDSNLQICEFENSSSCIRGKKNFSLF